MKFHSILLATLNGICAAVTATAADPPTPQHPLLWKVEGKGLNKPSYLFGTIHVGPKMIGPLHPSAVRALEASDAVYTEVPMDSASQLGLAQHYIRRDGRTLTAAIGEELVKRLDTALGTINPALDSTPFQSFKTWAVALSLPLLETQLSGDTPLDIIIWNHAARKGKATRALEKPEDQFDIFDDLTEEEQIILLADTLRLLAEARKTGEDAVDALATAYRSGDTAKVEAELNRQLEEVAKGEHRELGERLIKRIFHDRNRSMATAIATRLSADSDQSHFFAVGAGHYLGPDNIRARLAGEGFTITRVEASE